MHIDFWLSFLAFDLIAAFQGLTFTLSLSRAGWDLKVVDEGAKAKAKAKVALMNLQLKWPTGESWIVIISSSSTPSTLLQEGGSTPPFYFYSLKLS